MQNPQDLQSLVDPSSELFEQSWNTFFLDVARVRAVCGGIPPEAASALLAAGQKWQGTGWNTGKASKILYSLTGVPLVKGVWSEYRNAFLYALALFLEVEVPELDLSDRVADAAFALLNVFAGADAQPSGTVVQGYDSRSGDPGSYPGAGHPFAPTEDSEDEVQLTWDEQKLPLPAELAYIWAGTVAGERRLDLKTILASYPRFAQLPATAPTNNHRGDGASKQDKKEKSWQQTLLHGLRMLAAVYLQVQQPFSPPLECPIPFCTQGSQESVVQTGSQQLFQLLVELYLKIEASRKEASLPGSMGPSGEVLFDKSELQAAMQQRRINRMGKGVPTFAPTRTYGRFFSSTGRGFGAGHGFGFGFGGRGFGKGKGKAPFYRRPWGPKGGKGPNRIDPARLTTSPANLPSGCPPPSSLTEAPPSI